MLYLGIALLVLGSALQAIGFVARSRSGRPEAPSASGIEAGEAGRIPATAFIALGIGCDVLGVVCIVLSAL